MVHERAEGTLLGQAVGDALGTTFEFQDARSIASRYPDGPRDIVGGGPFRLLPGQVTDDTELALALARSLADRGTWDPAHVAAKYAGWYRSGPFDIGGTTARAFGGSADPVAMAGRASRESQANGALMRASPLGVWGAGRARAVVAAAAAGDASLSHPHPACVAANVVFVLAIAFAVRERAGPADVFHEAERICVSERQAAPAAPWLAAARTGAPAEFHRQMGWVAIAFQNAFHQLRAAPSFEAGVVDTIRRGGDTDTNAAIAGALLGAAHGATAIPRRWVDPVLACRTSRPLEYQCGDLLALAASLVG